MINKIFAPFSLTLLAVFMAIILIYVPRIELIIITVGCVAMAAYDFWRSFQPGGDAYENTNNDADNDPAPKQ
jgi:hypothetical protein